MTDAQLLANANLLKNVMERARKNALNRK